MLRNVDDVPNKRTHVKNHDMFSARDTWIALLLQMQNIAYSTRTMGGTCG